MIPIIKTLLGKQTGEEIYQDAYGRYWVNADPFIIKNPPTGTEFATKVGNYILENKRINKT